MKCTYKTFEALSHVKIPYALCHSMSRNITALFWLYISNKVFFRHRMLWTFWNWKTLTYFGNQTKPLERTSLIKLYSKPNPTWMQTNFNACITYCVLIFLQRIETSIYILSKLSLAAATYQKTTIIKNQIFWEMI